MKTGSRFSTSIRLWNLRDLVVPLATVMVVVISFCSSSFTKIKSSWMALPSCLKSPGFSYITKEHILTNIRDSQLEGLLTVREGYHGRPFRFSLPYFNFYLLFIKDMRVF